MNRIHIKEHNTHQAKLKELLYWMDHCFGRLKL